MNKSLVILLLVFSLTGCPGGNHEGAEFGDRQSIYIDNPHICFSVNQNDVLSRYTLERYGKENKQLLIGERVKLTYPDTCFNVALTSGVSYAVSYMLNGKNYYDSFIIDIDGIIHQLGE
ncbi:MULTISPECIES: putative T6SS immunity periplasmic lipoprotein [Citrobacter]|uniref:putative T6SS immunity periplasmic lipoprotein n=1 Tax=Citrobacter TaxID=544 RepID=UPI000E3CA2A9|nr:MULTISPECIES: putative T6SS immunity periplasmic lipoprotein [Citrobacter]MBD0826819.1 hypothetical protein [Citrobacter sp. C1]RFU90623.1 hypothetical protein DZA29_15410 [Citrobacter gillenii]